MSVRRYLHWFTVGLVFLMFGMHVVGFTAYAQSSPKMNPDEMDPTEMAAKQTDLMTSRLELDEAQIGIVREVNLRYAEELKEVAMSSGGRRDKFSKFRDLHSKKDAELKEIFSESQYADYQKFKAELRQKMRERRK